MNAMLEGPAVSVVNTREYRVTKKYANIDMKLPSTLLNLSSRQLNRCAGPGESELSSRQAGKKAWAV